MSVIMATRNPESSQAANGRFSFAFAPNLPPSLFDLSIDLQAKYTAILPDDRGILIQLGEDETGQFHNRNDIDPPKAARVYSLAFDASGRGEGRYTWQYTVATPDTGRVVHTLSVTEEGADTITETYDRQGILIDSRDEPTDSPLAQIQAILAGDIFKQHGAARLEERVQAEARLARYTLKLTQQGLSGKRRETLLEKPTKATQARGFCPIAPLPTKAAQLSLW